MKRSSGFKYFGIVLILAALGLMTGLFTLGTWCLGFSSSLLGCGGISVPLSLVVGSMFAVIGTVVYVRS